MPRRSKLQRSSVIFVQGCCTSGVGLSAPEVTIDCGGGSSASRDISTVYCSDWACANPSFPAMLSLTPPSAIEVLLPTDDFVQHFGVCQQIMQRRMSLRGDLPHSVVDPFLEFGLVDRGITAPARCKLAVCRHLATARKSGSCTGFSTLSVPYSSEATETCVGYKYPAATCLRSHFQVQAPSHKTAAPATCMSKASSTSFHS